MLHAVIMAGGSGTRFWPLSRRSRPKQFLELTGGRSLIQMAHDRCRPAIPPERIWVVTNDRMAEQTGRHLPAVPAGQILREPCGRNTAPCIGLAALCLTSADPEATMLVMPADHLIEPVSEFQSAVELAATAVQDDPARLVLFGVPPTYPATGFGYIERAGTEAAGHPGGHPQRFPLFQVASFREKPDRVTAEEYLRTGRFYWNCGIFVWKAERILQAIREYEPEIAVWLDELRPYIGSGEWDAQLQTLFPRMKSISIDYAVLERERNISVLEAPFDWDDVGNWEAIGRHHPADDAGNVVIGRHCGLESRGCIVHASGNHLIATIGIHDCIIVQTSDATLIADRRDDNAVRQLVELLEQQGYGDVL